MRHLCALLLISAGAAGVFQGSTAMAQNAVRLHAAGSLREVTADLARAFQSREGVAVTAQFGPSGHLKERIEAGEAAEVFASANMNHPAALSRSGKSGPVVLFARNRLCALAQPGLAIQTATVLDVLLDPKVKVGTSTPASDPSGDYVWEIFRKAERIRPGSYAKLDAKALKLTRRPDSPRPPPNRIVYAWVMEQHLADVFLCYCTSAAVAAGQVQGLQVISLPAALSVGADYGLTVMKDASPAAHRFAMFVLSPAGQALLARYGFDAPGLPETVP